MRLCPALVMLLAAGTLAAAAPAAPVNWNADLHGDLLIVSAPAGNSFPAAIEQQLAQRLSLDMTDVPITDVVSFLQKVTTLNWVLDPRLHAQPRPVTLKVSDMEARNVLDFIVRTTGIWAGWRDGAIYLAEAAPANAMVTRTYRVGDLLHTMNNYPGPDLSIPQPGSTGARLLPPIPAPVAGNPDTEFLDLIRTVIKP